MAWSEAVFYSIIVISVTILIIVILDLVHKVYKGE